jgi:peptide-methionine (S)-S-oxide reductase
MNEPSSSIEKAVLGGGCFWCLDAVFREVKGVTSVVCGYAGGLRPSPTYEQICSGATGHAEVVEITFDASIISFNEILQIFFVTHDPTTLNRQGNDIGTQYRSVVFCQSNTQEVITKAVMAKVQANFSQPLVTEVVTTPTPFWPAEDEHQDYWSHHPQQGYCQIVVAPKVAKFRHALPHFQKR